MGPRSRRRVEAYYSTTAKDPKLHLELSCGGLRSVQVYPDCKLARRDFASLHTLGGAEWSRPCRKCALERVLDAVLRPGPRDRLVFTTFSSQPSYGADSLRFVTNEVSDTGRDRLERVAARLDLEMVHTKAGPAAYGFLPNRGVKVLERNLRTQIHPRMADMPSRAYMTTFWTFLDDAPPELSVAGPGGPDPWAAAELICTT